MTANCKSDKFRRKTGMSKKVACDFHKADKGKYHEEDMGNGLDRIKELAGIDEMGDEENKILSALEIAYTFISSPQRMESRKIGPTVITYHTNKYNEITAKLRDAIIELRNK